MTYSISYDLKQPGRNYDDLYNVIKSAPSWAHAMDSLWFISTGESAETWSNRLRQVMDQNDWCQWTIKLTHYRTIKLTHPPALSLS